ncbi:dicarboxylate/amino acid:cation symporter [Celerinatantimonas diazotrophica]|uniref:Na+/H+-dicarboxylate symporter n=1 Tax=Celerinatantimonas diazotrophica TaxID=412034 RepID=A0A4R1K432_9GAMM|nr:dicarboxylate/amino acid:cation symporter [Celerinatantimonas diazotrophica]TCK58875.1 Na+/H+-dicarboxylate symporter [Celerinatantimonas diazotrophica]CAG9297507.1 Proton/glutamate-aspartate symporter [Celerinatantimonas diazotrophica]
MFFKSKYLKNVGVQVIIAMIVGSLIGFVMGPKAAMFAPLGTLFINLIQMLVIPLVVVAIIVGSASLGSGSNTGKVGGTTLLFFAVTSALAVALALALGAIFTPGAGIDIHTINAHFSTQYADKGEIAGFWPTILAMIPTNLFQAMSHAKIIQILVFCMFFGIGLSKLPKQRREPLTAGIQAVCDVLIWMINKVMLVAPIGVFGLMAKAVGNYGFSLLSDVLQLFWVFVLGIAIFAFIVYPLMVQLLSRTSAIQFIKAMKKPQVVALSTASSMATLPVNMETVEKDLKVSNSTTSFVLPLGATINMTGGAIYYGLVAMFFAQLFHVHLGLGAYCAIIATATIGAVGQAGVPGPTFLVVAVLLAANIPIQGLPLLFALDRIFDMIRTALNITGDAATAVIVDGLVCDMADQPAAATSEVSS